MDDVTKRHHDLLQASTIEARSIKASTSEQGAGLLVKDLAKGDVSLS